MTPMEDISAVATSAASRASSVPPCVAARARELLDIAVLKLLLVIVASSAGCQLLALSVALLAPPHLHYLPGMGR